VDKIGKMVDMSLPAAPSIGDMPEAVNIQLVPQYPYGLSICLNSPELDKLGLEGDCEVGDMLHMHCFAKVTNVSKSEANTRIELQITMISAEDENAENEEYEAAEEEAPRKVKNPYKK